MPSSKIGQQARIEVSSRRVCPQNARHLVPFSRYFGTAEPDIIQRQEGQIVQSSLNLDDFLRAPWKGARSLRVQIPSGKCRSSR